MTVTEWIPIGTIDQLEFDFSFEYGLGTEAEAKEIFDAVGDLHRSNDKLPDGWKFLGAGGSRRVYLSPTRVVYKISYMRDDDDAPSYNDLEHANFRRIENSGKLPKGWKIPKNHLHVFTANYTRWNYNTREEVLKPGRVAVLACEYIDGELMGGGRGMTVEAKDAFLAVGLTDWYGQNAAKTADGTYYIIDAAEDMED